MNEYVGFKYFQGVTLSKVLSPLNACAIFISVSILLPRLARHFSPDSLIDKL